MKVRSLTSLLAAALLPWVGNALPAQGAFVNYEDPQIKPIAVATVNGNDYVLACNTPDNSVEVYRAAWDMQQQFIARVPVGLSPVTVKFDPSTNHFYTCNYLGDSVSKVHLAHVPGSNPPTVTASIERTVRVGDEPTDLAFTPGDAVNGPGAMVTLHSRSAIAVIRLSDLTPTTPDQIPTAAATPLAQYMAAAEQKPTIAVAHVKAPRRIAYMPAATDQRTFVLNTMGGHVESASGYDLGLFTHDPLSTGAQDFALGQVGSTNFSFAINGAGTRMYIASQKARNLTDGVALLRQRAEPASAPSGGGTGFVQTWLQIVDIPVTTPRKDPELVSEQTPGGPVTLFRSINLNRDYSVTAADRVVAKADTLAQVTDVILIPDDVDPVNNPEQVVLAAFGSDKVAILRHDATQPSGYAIMRVAIPPLTVQGYSAAGPRGLAFSGSVTETGQSTAGVVFVLNRLDNSLAVVSPWTGNVTRRLLMADPTPGQIRAGRKFLYSAIATSGNGTVSCSSCHVDARTDALQWKLHSPEFGPSISTMLLDGVHEAKLPSNGSDRIFPANKPPMMTQTLQGLLNFHLEPMSLQFMATNAPYHWRGDKNTFQDFNEAFVNLQAMPALPGSDEEPRGITTTEMDSYTAFVNTIHHPPNPEQQPDRKLTGDIGPGDPAVAANTIGTGSGGLEGRKAFHIMDALDGRSCVNCHQLPEGSSNTITFLEDHGDPNSVLEPFETAALRNLRPREMLIPAPNFESTGANGAPVFWPLVGAFGLLHQGIGSLGPDALFQSFTINDNVAHDFPQTVNVFQNNDEITQYVRELDTGSAPLVGFAWTMTVTPTAFDHGLFDLVEDQAGEGNIGVAAHLRIGGAGGTLQGYWLDVTRTDAITGEPLYQLEGGTSTQTLTRTALAALVSGSGNDMLIVQCTPAGSERRLANLNGAPAPLTGTPSNLQLLPMAPMTANVGITDMTVRIDPSSFTGLGIPRTMIAQATFAAKLGGQGYGVPTTLRHEPPRRLRVRGSDIRNGAELGLGIATTGVAQNPVVVWFDLTPTKYRDTAIDPVTGQPYVIWETTEELDALQTLALLCGGYNAPGVLPLLLGGDPDLCLTLMNLSWNQYQVTVRNASTSSGTATSWQSLSVADAR